jgi:hypothetical protein
MHDKEEIDDETEDEVEDVCEMFSHTFPSKRDTWGFQKSFSKQEFQTAGGIHVLQRGLPK